MNRNRVGCLLWALLAVVVVLSLAQFWPDDDDPRLRVPCETALAPAAELLGPDFDRWFEACRHDPIIREVPCDTPVEQAVDRLTQDTFQRWLFACGR